MGESILGEKSSGDQHQEADGPYGWELILDLHDCDLEGVGREELKRYFDLLCSNYLKMEPCDLHFWDDEGVPEDEKQTDPKTKGISAVQFIITSNVTIHTLPELRKVFLNVFSCQEFPADRIAEYSRGFFGGKMAKLSYITRI